MTQDNYNAIARILKGTLLNDSKLVPLINTLTEYFKSEDDTFNETLFREESLNNNNKTEDRELEVKIIDT
jgi:hypothetical protein